MKQSTRDTIYSLIKSSILRKIEKYKSETDYRPFFQAIFNDRTIRLASIVQSVYTTFGMSIYEQVALILAREAGFFAERQYQLLGSINSETRILIGELCDKSISQCVPKTEEIELIRKVVTPGDAIKMPNSTVDLFLCNDSEHEYFIDVTTVKLNKKGARALREKMLTWAAMRFSQNPSAQLETFIGIPYNPYFPENYRRSFVVSNCHNEEVLVQNDFWSLVAGYDVFDDLLGIFREVGVEIEPEISKFIE